MRNHAILLTLVVFAAGCGAEFDVEVGAPATDSGQYLLAAEPSSVQTPTEIKETVSEPSLISIAGRVDAGDIEPFQDGIATFVISQLPDAAHAGDDPDHAENCPFCKRKLKNAPKAVVRFLDDSGNVLPVDARELLGIRKGDVVVVRGLATYLEAVNTVQIDAEGVFVRPSES